MIDKVEQFLRNIGADTSVEARYLKCREEDRELFEAYYQRYSSDMVPMLLSETCDRIITGYALLLSLGGSEADIVAKMAEVEARPEYGGRG